MSNFFTIRKNDSPLICSAIHRGHQVRESLKALYALDEKERFREEDPFTDEIAESMSGSIVLVNRSRFEVDINRPPEKAIYLSPDDSWGLNVWKEVPDKKEIKKSLDLYQEFYRQLDFLLESTIERYGYFIFYDIHSYNHRRNSPNEKAPPENNPDVNVGTGNTDAGKWRNVIDTFIGVLSEQKIEDHMLDVRENVKFRGGYLSKHIHQTFGSKGCTFAIEFKKIFMDEWTGHPYTEKIIQLIQALQATVDPVLEKAKNEKDRR